MRNAQGLSLTRVSIRFEFCTHAPATRGQEQRGGCEVGILPKEKKQLAFDSRNSFKTSTVAFSRVNVIHLLFRNNLSMI